MIYPSLSASLVQLQALANFIDEGNNNAHFIFYDDMKPANTTVATNEDAKLVTLNLPKPCFRELGVDYIELQPTGLGTIVKTGNARWARLFNGNGVVVADFLVGTDITLAATSFTLGGTLSIIAIKLKPYLN